MLDKIKAGLLLSLFLAISAGSTAAFLIGPQKFSGQVLGAQCRPGETFCRRNEECCSGQCLKQSKWFQFWWSPGRCAPEVEKPPQPTTKPPTPTISPPPTNCNQLKNLKVRIEWTTHTIDLYCQQSIKKTYCQNLQSIKNSLQSLTQKVDQLYQRCLKEQIKPTISSRPTITPVPTRKVKKCGINSFAVRNPCSQNGFYKSAYAVCYDGAKFNKEGSCLSSKQWRQQAEIFCKGHCSSNSPTSVPIPSPNPTSLPTPIHLP